MSRKKIKVAYFLFLLLLNRRRRNGRRRRRFWVRPSLREKQTENMLRLCREDDEGLMPEEVLRRGYFKAFLRLTFGDFKFLLSKVSKIIQKQDTNYRMSISPLERLAVTIRFLATGDNYNTLEKLFNISTSSISKFIPITCRAIISTLESYIKVPGSSTEWQNIADAFEQWNFPNCIGAIDGRHCPIISPKFSGTDFYNYKNFFSVVLMAVVDADYNFIYIDVGAQGRISDSGIFNNCNLKRQLDNDELLLPPPKPLPHSTLPVPYVFLADDAFPLSENIMKPMKGVTEEGSPERMYNYRVSRARRVVENAFGVVSARFRVLRKPMCLNPDNAALIIMTCCYLHNFIRRNQSSSAMYTPPGFIDSSDQDDGAWRNIQQYGPMNGLIPWRNYPRKSPQRAKSIREEFVRYFSTPEGTVSWPIPYH